MEDLLVADVKKELGNFCEMLLKSLSVLLYGTKWTRYAFYRFNTIL